MPSVRYYNQTAPFWDFLASMEEQGPPPFFTGNNADSDSQHPRSNPWTEGWAGFPFGPMPHHGRRGSNHGRRHSQHPPPPPQQEHDAKSNEEAQDPEEVAPEARGPPPPFTDEPAGPHSDGHPHHGPGPRHGRHGGRGRGGWGGRGRGGPCAFGNAGQMGGFGMGGFGELAEMFQSQMFGQQDPSSKKESTQDFKPEADVFDTENSFVVHVSLPGAKKEDISVSWSADASQLIIAGVVHRPGDEELLKTLALDERKVGAFERKVRLGSRANPAQVDADSISAKLEDGVLRIDVPKLDSEYVEIKKVDIE